MPRDLLRQFFDTNFQARTTELNGCTITRFRLTPYDPLGTLVPVADVEVSGSIISGVPLSANNRELTNILPGTPVKMTRSITGRLEVTGVNKRGGTSTFLYTFSLPQLTPETSAGVSALSQGVVTSQGSQGIATRSSDLSELDTAHTTGGGGFGTTPLGTTLLVDLDGNILQTLG
jgi:hypothetical protein